MFELHVLLLFMILGAIIAVEIKDLLSSVVAVGAVGLGLSVALDYRSFIHCRLSILCLSRFERFTVVRESHNEG